MRLLFPARRQCQCQLLTGSHRYRFLFKPMDHIHQKAAETGGQLRPLQGKMHGGLQKAQLVANVVSDPLKQVGIDRLLS